MPGDDYSAAVSGGLKLKGVNSSSKVSKHKKKRSKPAQPTESEKNPDKSEDATDGALTEDLKSKGEEAGDITRKDHGGEGSREREREEEATPPPQRAGKTEAELRHEERRRKRVRFPILMIYAGDAIMVDFADCVTAGRTTKARRHQDA